MLLMLLYCLFVTTSSKSVQLATQYYVDEKAKGRQYYENTDIKLATVKYVQDAFDVTEKHKFDNEDSIRMFATVDYVDEIYKIYRKQKNKYVFNIYVIDLKTTKRVEVETYNDADENGIVYIDFVDLVEGFIKLFTENGDYDFHAKDYSSMLCSSDKASTCKVDTKEDVEIGAVILIDFNDDDDIIDTRNHVIEYGKITYHLINSYLMPSVALFCCNGYNDDDVYIDRYIHNFASDNRVYTIENIAGNDVYVNDYVNEQDLLKKCGNSVNSLCSSKSLLSVEGKEHVVILNESDYDHVESGGTEPYFTFCWIDKFKKIDWKIFNFLSTRNMFWQCEKYETLNLTGMDVSNVKDMSSMFSFAINLETLDIRSFDIDINVNIKNMFYKCNKLATIYMTEATYNKVKNELPNKEGKRWEDAGFVDSTTKKYRLR